MLSVVFVGFLTGLLVSFSFGAGFFSIIRTSISKGKKKAFLISLGLIASDIIFILLTVFASGFISSELIKHQQLIRLCGTAMLVLLGLYLIRKSVKSYRQLDLEISNKPGFAYFAKGFIINSLNPLTIFTWIATTLFVQTAFGFSYIKICVFYAAIAASLFISQYAVCYFANKLGKWLKPKGIHQINIIAGVVIIILGIVLYFSKNINTQNTPINKVQKIITPY